MYKIVDSKEYLKVITLSDASYLASEKVRKRQEKQNWDYKRKQLKLMISSKYYKKRVIKNNQEIHKAHFEKNTPLETKKFIHKIITEACQKEKNEKIKEHEGKKKTILRLSDQSPKQQQPKLKPKMNQYPGVICTSASTYSNEILPLLNKGQSFKVSPFSCTMSI